MRVVTVDCDVCGDPNAKTYYLQDVRYDPKTGKPSGSGRGAGAIDICPSCWERYCKPRMRERKMANPTA
jgi:hypothetical protein